MATLAMLRAWSPRRVMMSSLRWRSRWPAGTCWIASISAHRKIGDPCLVMWPRLTLTSDPRCRGVSPAQEHSSAGRGNPGDVADLGHDHRAWRRADAGQGADRLVALVVLKQPGDGCLEQGDLVSQQRADLAPRDQLPRIR